MFTLNENTKNRRYTGRLQATHPAWIRNGNGAFERIQVTDISLGGAAVDWDGEGAEPETELHVVLNLRAGSYLCLKAKTAWSEGTRVGLQFTQTESELEKFLHFQLGGYIAKSKVRRLCTVDRARLRRERTVPRGMARMSATS